MAQTKPFTPIENAILDALTKTKLSGDEHRIVLAVARLSFGWGSDRTKPMDWRMLADKVGITGKASVVKASILRLTNNLQRRHILLIEQTEEGCIYAINPDVKEWDNNRSRNQMVTMNTNNKTVTSNQMVTNNQTVNMQEQPNGYSQHSNQTVTKSDPIHVYKEIKKDKEIESIPPIADSSNKPCCKLSLEPIGKGKREYLIWHLHNAHREVHPNAPLCPTFDDILALKEVWIGTKVKAVDVGKAYVLYLKDQKAKVQDAPLSWFRDRLNRYLEHVNKPAVQSTKHKIGSGVPQETKERMERQAWCEAQVKAGNVLPGETYGQSIMRLRGEWRKQHAEAAA
jgi:hypothetical protein